MSFEDMQRRKQFKVQFSIEPGQVRKTIPTEYKAYAIVKVEATEYGSGMVEKLPARTSLTVIGAAIYEPARMDVLYFVGVGIGDNPHLVCQANTDARPGCTVTVTYVVKGVTEDGDV